MALLSRNGYRLSRTEPTPRTYGPSHRRRDGDYRRQESDAYYFPPGSRGQACSYNREWGLPELSAELDVTDENQSRYEGIDGEVTEFDPGEHTRVRPPRCRERRVWIGTRGKCLA